MKTYVTFGQNHAHSVNGKTFDKDCVAVIDCKSEEEGIDKAFEFFGPKFFTTYFADDFDIAKMEYYRRGFINVNFS